MNIIEQDIYHSTQIRVRYADTDKMGIVNNGKYFTYFEVGRTELMRHFGLPYIEFEKAGYLLPLIETKAIYKSPAFYDDLLDIETILKLRYSPIIRFDYKILRGITTIALGYTLHSFIDNDKRLPIKPPKMFYQVFLEKFNKEQK